jgi:hypothetical protein
MSTNRICRECGNPADDDEAPSGYDDVGLQKLCFAKTAQTPAEPPGKTGRRARWITDAAAVAIAVAVGIGVAVALSKNEVKSASRAPSGGGRTLDRIINVRGHPRRQAYGPNYSQHRQILIPPYRGPARAA